MFTEGSKSPPGSPAAVVSYTEVHPSAHIKVCESKRADMGTGRVSDKQADGLAVTCVVLSGPELSFSIRLSQFFKNLHRSVRSKQTLKCKCKLKEIAVKC